MVMGLGLGLGYVAGNMDGGVCHSVAFQWLPTTFFSFQQCMIHLYSYNIIEW